METTSHYPLGPKIQDVLGWCGYRMWRNKWCIDRLVGLFTYSAWLRDSSGRLLSDSCKAIDVDS